jgi:hypothetical protein
MSPLYETLRDLGDNLQSRLEDPKAANTLGLSAIRACPAEDWSWWLRWLTAEPDRKGPAKKNALGVVVAKYSSARPEDREVAADLVAMMADIGGGPFREPKKVVADASTLGQRSGGRTTKPPVSKA